MAVQTQGAPHITLNGRTIDDEYTVVSFSLTKKLVEPNRLALTLRKNRLLRTDDDIHFADAEQMVGAEISLSLTTIRHDRDMESCGETVQFDGLVFEVQQQRQRMGGAAYVTLTAMSPDQLLADNPHCFSYEQTTLADIVDHAVQPSASRLKTEVKPRLIAAMPYIVQYNETTYQFLSRLARRYGEYMYYDEGRLLFGAMPRGREVELQSDTDVLSYAYHIGLDHHTFRHAQHNYLRYDHPTADGEQFDRQGSHTFTNLAYDASGELFKRTTLEDIHAATQEHSAFAQVDSSAEVQAWGAKSQLTTCRIETNRADLHIGDTVTIVENADSDEPTPVEHEPLTVVGLTMTGGAAGHFECTLEAIPTGSPLPPYGDSDIYPVCAPTRARVTDNRDPEHLGRLRVQFLWQELQDRSLTTPWIRMTQPHGGDDKGFYFIPEIGEEVMVDFEHGNAEKPYVSGTLYHGKQRPSELWYDNSNDVKAIRTRNGHTIEIHDEGQGGYIRIYDYQKENYILTYSTDERLIKLESTGNIELYAANDIIMRAGRNIETACGFNQIEQVGANRVQSVAMNDTEIVGVTQIVRVGHDLTQAIGNNQEVSVGADRTTQVGGNDSTQVGNDRQTSVAANNTLDVAEQHLLAAKNIRQEAEEKMLIYSKQHDQVSDEKMNIEGGNEVNMHAANIKIN